MKIREYLAAKTVTLCFLGIGAVAAGIFLHFVGADAALIFTAEIGIVLMILAWLLCSFWLDNRRLLKLKQMERELPEAYLLGELLPAPVNVVEKQYFLIMKAVSHSAIDLAEQAKREKEEYCDYVESWIHEMKTPLTACSLILANGGDHSKLKREWKRADNLTESILYYARLRTAERDTQIKAVQVSEVINQAVKSQMELLVAANISVDTEGDFSVYSDEKQLCFILKQLLINCAKYCPACHVTITAADGILTIEDDGIGIPSHEIRRVTERGFTGSNGRRLGGSTGMGLYIVSELCKKLNITLSIQSTQGEFTRVLLAFDILTKQ